jgi:hypothetical protein
MTLVSVLAVPLASMVRTTDVRTGGREVSAIEDKDPRAIRFKGEDRRGRLLTELLRPSEVVASEACDTIVGLGFKKLATVLLRCRPLLARGEAGPEVEGKAGAKHGFSGDTGRASGMLGKWLLTGDEYRRVGFTLDGTDGFLAAVGVAYGTLLELVERVMEGREGVGG